MCQKIYLLAHFLLLQKILKDIIIKKLNKLFLKGAKNG